MIEKIKTCAKGFDIKSYYNKEECEKECLSIVCKDPQKVIIRIIENACTIYKIEDVAAIIDAISFYCTIKFLDTTILYWPKIQIENFLVNKRKKKYAKKN